MSLELTDQNMSGSPFCPPHTRSPLPVVRKYEVSVLHYRVACEPALGVVPLRRLVSRVPGVNVSDAAS